jgi:hypothetical protein
MRVEAIGVRPAVSVAIPAHQSPTLNQLCDTDVSVRSHTWKVKGLGAGSDKKRTLVFPITSHFVCPEYALTMYLQ